MTHDATRFQAQANHRNKGARRSLRALLILLAGLILPQAVLAAGPDTTARSFLILDEASLTTNVGAYIDTSYQQPTATATSTWALVGNAGLSGNAYIAGACCTNYDYVMNPVIVTGPFDGNPNGTQLILPPPLPDPTSVERFGAALAIHGNRIAVGSTEALTEIPTFPNNFPRWWPSGGGRVHLYQHNGTSFLHERTIVHGAISEQFGYAADLRQNTLLVGRPGASPGAADLFDPASGAHITTFTSPASGDKFGETVALLDDLAFVGASGSGTVYVYRHDGNGNWAPAGTLASPGAASEFGAAIDVDNGRILVGAPAIARAYIFEDDGDAVWPVMAEIAGGATSRLGQAVALTGDTAFVGAPQLLLGVNRVGIVVRHERAVDGTWPFVSFKGSRAPANGDGFGSLVSASSTLLSVAQAGDATRPGEFYIFSPQAGVPDADADTVSDYGDNCAVYNPGQEDLDGDEIGDACDSDIDNDGLSNTDEANIGTDPYNPDTDGDSLNDSDDPYPTNPDGDGDGANDSVDNCPQISNPTQGNVDGDAYGDACDDNIDGDSLSNAAESTLGTDPYNPDTDADLHRDGEDYLPLDAKDGWAKKYRFSVNADQMSLGADVLLAVEGDKRTMHAYAKTNGAWTEVPAPVIPGAPMLELYGGGAAGNRFVALVFAPGFSVKPQFYLLQWTVANGWVQHASTDFTGLPLNMVRATVGPTRIVIEVALGDTYSDFIYNLTPTGPQLIESTAQIDHASAASRGMADNHLFSLRFHDDLITSYDLLNGYSSQAITWPNPTEGLRLGEGFYPVGPNKVLVDAANNSFWMSRVNGVWTLQLSGIPKWAYQSDHISGGDGTVVVYDLDPATQNGLDLYRVHRVNNAAEVGKFNEWSQGYSRIQTNGKVVVQARRYDANPVVDIFEVPAPPPGC